MVFGLLWLLGFPGFSQILAAPVFEKLATFGTAPNRAARGPLCLASDGNFYLSLESGGGYGCGALCRVDPSTGTMTVLVEFTGLAGEHPGAGPRGGLHEDGQGNLWGTTTYGGAKNLGTVFKLNLGSGQLTTTAEFTNDDPIAAQNPNGELIETEPGILMGTAMLGGSSNGGAIFVVNTVTGSLATSLSSGSTYPAGSSPQAGLFRDPETARLWGTTAYGGANAAGTVFVIGPEYPSSFTTASFGGAFPGSLPLSTLVSDGQGSLWGTTYYGGTEQRGTVFKVDGQGHLALVAQFPADGGSNPKGPLISDGLGNLWGTTEYGGAHFSGTVFKVNILTGALTTVADFSDQLNSTGAYPQTGLTGDGKGSFWGATNSGGTFGCGTVFKVDIKTGVISKVVVFQLDAGVNQGRAPIAGLTDDGSGTLWGTTSSGGDGPYGTIFKLNPASGAVTTVVRFTGTSGDCRGRDPEAKLVRDGSGWLWGTTYLGGTTNAGTVFKVNVADGTFATMADLTQAQGGFRPQGGLADDGLGNMWGTASAGGDNQVGTIFKVNRNSGAFTTIVNFTDDGPSNRGSSPYAGLVNDGAGYLWGSTPSGGTKHLGTIFKVEIASGELTTIADFSNGLTGADRGHHPAADLVNDGAGNLWGTAEMGGVFGAGTVFKVAIATGTLTTVADHARDAMSNRGSSPEGPLFVDGTGFVWGMTSSGGRNNLGTIYRVNMVTGELITQVDFTGRSGASPGAAPAHSGLVKGADGKLYGVTANGGATSTGAAAGGGQIFRVTPDIATELPSLDSPAANQTFAGPVDVDFHLPEPAITGSVTLKLDNGVGVVRTLTLAARHESAGAHAFAFSGTLTSDIASISGGQGLPEGRYTVMLSYRDVFGNARAAVSSASVLVDRTPPRASVRESLTIAAAADGMAQLGDLTDYVTRSDNFGTPSIAQSPPATGMLPLGDYPVTFTVTDSAGNHTAVSMNVTIAYPKPDSPEVTASLKAGPVVNRAATGAPIRAGTALPDGATLGAFGTPAIDDHRKLVAAATILSGRGRLGAIYVEDALGNGAVPAYQTGPVLNGLGEPLPGVTFKSFRDPLISSFGEISVAATLTGAGAKVDEGVWTTLLNLEGKLEMLLREGNPVPGFPDGEKLKSVTSLSAWPMELLATIKLVQDGRLVTAKNDTALLWLTRGVQGKVLLRTGAPLSPTVEGPLVKNFSILRPALGSAGQGRWGTSGSAVAKVTLEDGAVVIAAINQFEATRLLSTADYPIPVGPYLRWKSFGLPAVGRYSSNYAVTGTLKPSRGFASSKDDEVMIFSSNGTEWRVVARKNDSAPIAPPTQDTESPRFARFFDPVVNEAGDLAFMATLQGPGVTDANRTGLFSGPADAVALVARLGGKVPDESGNFTEAKWNRFLTCALPDGEAGGVIFLAETRGGDSTAANKLGLWGIDSTGKLRRLLRTQESQRSGPPALKSFSLLTSSSTVFSASRSFNSTGSVAVRAIFTDKTEALLRVDIP